MRLVDEGMWTLMARETSWDPLRWKIWAWIIEDNEGTGGDIGDLGDLLVDNGWPCPSSLEVD